MTGQLEGKVALVTGAAMGMGEATARLFAREGARVMLSDIDASLGEAVAGAIRAEGGQARFFRSDVADESAVAALVAETVEAFGGLDCAVNNAAVKPDTKFTADADLAEFDRIVAVNLRAVLACMKHELRQMLAQGRGGAIVNIGSVSSVRPQAGNIAYVAAKHGVVGLTKTASLEYAGQNIRVNAVLPGAIDTPMIRKAFDDIGVTEEAVAGSLSLFNRLGRPEEVAAASLWLCSGASSFVTGHCLAVEAGYLSR